MYEQVGSSRSSVAMTLCLTLFWVVSLYMAAISNGNPDDVVGLSGRRSRVIYERYLGRGNQVWAVTHSRDCPVCLSSLSRTVKWPLLIAQVFRSVRHKGYK